MNMEAPTIGIGRLIKEGGRFVVPHHQRDYSWTEDEIDQLFEDILSAIDTTQAEYFLGLMVFMPSKDRTYTILDGQQRLATTTLILSAVRTWLKARNYEEDANQIQSSYIAARELGSSAYEPLLVLNQNNNPYFERYVVTEAADDEIQAELGGLKRYDSSRWLLEAALACRRQVHFIADKADTTDSAAQHLFNIVKCLRDGVKVVRLNVQSEANAYTVFETLNARGLDLSVLDLVKNQILGRTRPGSQLRDTQNRWTQMMATLANIRADEFLKAWWTSRHGRVQTAHLFPSFKKRVKDSPSAEAASRDMLSASEITQVFRYRMILFGRRSPIRREIGCVH